jgi:hypothetical protein
MKFEIFMKITNLFNPLKIIQKDTQKEETINMHIP